MSNIYIVRRQLDQWRDLKAWGKSLRDVDLTVSDASFAKRRGTAWPKLNKVNVYLQPSIPGMLKTGVHEFAHIASPGGHGYQWQATFTKAIMEITGEYVPVTTLKEVDEGCYYAMLKWWKKQNVHVR